MKVLVTGSRGIGKAIALELSKAGHELLLVSKDYKNLKRTSECIGKLYNSEVLFYQCELSNKNEINKLFKFCEEKFSPDVLILNAGIFLEGSLTNSNTESFQKILDVNLFSIYNLVKTFVGELKKKENPKIILIGSIAGMESYSTGALYSVSKWALKGYAVNLRQELMEFGIGVTILNPGGTLTDMWAGDNIPENRLLEAADIGKLVSTILELSPQAVVEEIVIRPMLGEVQL